MSERYTSLLVAALCAIFTLIGVAIGVALGAVQCDLRIDATHTPAGGRR